MARKSDEIRDPKAPTSCCGCGTSMRAEPTHTNGCTRIAAVRRAVSRFWTGRWRHASGYRTLPRVLFGHLPTPYRSLYQLPRG